MTVRVRGRHICVGATQAWWTQNEDKTRDDDEMWYALGTVLADPSANKPKEVCISYLSVDGE